VDAVGLTGADMNIIRSDKRPVKTIDYGFAGDVKEVGTKPLTLLIDNGYAPVLSPLTHDQKGLLLNTNADTIAAETAKALAPFFDVTLIYCFEKSGVLLDANDDNSVIPRLSRALYEKYKAEGIIQGGMIPKLDNAFQALEAGVKQVIIAKATKICGDKGTVVSD
jgi:acetylglutamate kinase